MEPKVGGYYRTRNGTTIGPLRATPADDARKGNFPFISGHLIWTESGKYHKGDVAPPHHWDLMEEYTDPTLPPPPVKVTDGTGGAPATADTPLWLAQYNKVIEAQSRIGTIQAALEYLQRHESQDDVGGKLVVEVLRRANVAASEIARGWGT